MADGASAQLAAPGKTSTSVPELPPAPLPERAVKGSYIGVGVMKELADEFHLPMAATSRGTFMTRSRTVGDVTALTSSDAKGWRMATPRVDWGSGLSHSGSGNELRGPLAHPSADARAPESIAEGAGDDLGMLLEESVESPTSHVGTGAMTASSSTASLHQPKDDAAASARVAASVATAVMTGRRGSKPNSGGSLSGLAASDLASAVGKPVCVPLAASGAVTARSVAGAGIAGGIATGKGIASSVAATMTTQQASLRSEGKTVLAMVGLPARGKTAIARRLKRHLVWMGYKAEIFNVGNYRRELLGASQPAAFFDPCNPAGEDARAEMARIALGEMITALAGDSVDIAIFDATNSTVERRRWLLESLAAAELSRGVKFQLVFIESICTDEDIIRSNVQETKLKMPDYRDADESAAVADFMERIRLYATVYQPISDAEEGATRYIKLIDVGRQLIANRINGYLNSRIMFFLSNLHITPRPIWLSRHGESEYNVQGRIGGDSLLSPRGNAYALKLGAFVRSQYPPDTQLLVWTSCLRRTAVTASPIGRDIIRWKALDEIDAGVCDGMTYETIAATMPEEYAARARNKFTYRYPRGESYEDISHRLEPVIIELMRTKKPVLIVSHQATLRVLYAYLTDKPPEACPEALVPLHTVIQLTPRAYGCDEVRHELM